MSFWNQVKSGLGKAASEAEKQANLAKLNIQANDARVHVKRKVSDLGEATLALLRSGELTHPTLTAIYGEITEGEAKVKTIEEEIDATKAETKTDAKPDAKE